MCSVIYIKVCYFSHLALKLFLEMPFMTVCFRYLPLEEDLSLELEISIVSISQEVFSTQY